MKHAVLLVVALLSACAASGPRYAEHSGGAPSMPDRESRLVVFRQSSTPQYSVREARLELDRVAAGGVLPAGFRVFDVAPGSHTIVVDMWDAPGRCELTFEITGGATQYFEVVPRIASWLSAAPMMAAPPIPAGSLVGAALMLIGMAAESAGKTCGGAFSVVPVDNEAALPKLAQVRLSQ
jgi:hypothetical protein